MRTKQEDIHKIHQYMKAEKYAKKKERFETACNLAVEKKQQRWNPTKKLNKNHIMAGLCLMLLLSSLGILIFATASKESKAIDNHTEPPISLIPNSKNTNEQVAVKKQLSHPSPQAINEYKTTKTLSQKPQKTQYTQRQLNKMPPEVRAEMMGR